MIDKNQDNCLSLDRYNKLCEFMARKCVICHGFRRIPNTSYICSCQEIARFKWKFDELKIHPKSLKSKKWSDFNGSVQNESGEVISSLVDYSIIKAKEKALHYCYGKNEPDTEKEIPTIDRHLINGTNLVICGDKNSGKTLLATLVVLEIFRCGVAKKKQFSIDWVKMSELADLATWDNSKEISRDTLYELSLLDFLVIDCIDDIFQGKTSPPHTVSLNILFNKRRDNNKPTIFISTEHYYNMCTSPSYELKITSRMGTEFLNEIASSSNYLIRLEKSKD